MVIRSKDAAEKKPAKKMSFRVSQDGTSAEVLYGGYSVATIHHARSRGRSIRVLSRYLRYGFSDITLQVTPQISRLQLDIERSALRTGK